MAFSGLQKTRLGLAAFARSLYGSFAGKKETEIVFLSLDLNTTIRQRQPQLLTEISSDGLGLDQDLNGTVDLMCKIAAGQLQINTMISGINVNLETTIE